MMKKNNSSAETCKEPSLGHRNRIESSKGTIIFPFNSNQLQKPAEKQNYTLEHENNKKQKYQHDRNDS